jgi:hypothetical protein
MDPCDLKHPAYWGRWPGLDLVDEMRAAHRVFLENSSKTRLLEKIRYSYYCYPIQLLKKERNVGISSRLMVWYIADNRRSLYHNTEGPSCWDPQGEQAPKFYLRGENFTFEDWSNTVRLSDEHRLVIALKYGV